MKTAKLTFTLLFILFGTQLFARSSAAQTVTIKIFHSHVIHCQAQSLNPDTKYTRPTGDNKNIVIGHNGIKNQKIMVSTQNTYLKLLTKDPYHDNKIIDLSRNRSVELTNGSSDTRGQTEIRYLDSKTDGQIHNVYFTLTDL